MDLDRVKGRGNWECTIFIIGKPWSVFHSQPPQINRPDPSSIKIGRVKRCKRGPSVAVRVDLLGPSTRGLYPQRLNLPLSRTFGST